MQHGVVVLVAPSTPTIVIPSTFARNSDATVK